MALAALAQAVAIAEVGPFRPYLIETWPLAALTISLGMVKALICRGPFSMQVAVLLLELVEPADARCR